MDESRIRDMPPERWANFISLTRSDAEWVTISGVADRATDLAAALKALGFEVQIEGGASGETNIRCRRLPSDFAEDRQARSPRTV